MPEFVGPAVCPNCGNPLESGYLEGLWMKPVSLGPMGSSGTILWRAEVKISSGAVVPSPIFTELAPAAWYRFGPTPMFPARRCTSCKWVQFDYDPSVVGTAP